MKGEKGYDSEDTRPVERRVLLVYKEEIRVFGTSFSNNRKK